jgi:DinB superfamily
MNHMRMLNTLMVVGLAVSAMGQKPSASPAPTPTPQAQASPQAPPTIAATVESQVGIIEREFVAAAEAMPDDKFNFAPANLNIAGTKAVRTFAEQVRHVATVNFMLWAPLVGEKPPFDINGDEGPVSMTSKADIVKYLKDSYAMGHRAAKSLTADNVVDLIPSPFGAGKVPRLFSATFGVAHGFDHYGQCVEYLRMNGILPPASRGSN